MPQMSPKMHPRACILARPPNTRGQKDDATDEPEDATKSLHACFASFSSAQGHQPRNGWIPMPPLSPRMPPDTPRYELASLIISILIDQRGFETETLRPRPPTTWWARGAATDEPEDAPQEAPRPSAPTDASTNWRPWADEHDENQACKLPAASASCPSVIAGLGPTKT